MKPKKKVFTNGTIEIPYEVEILETFGSDGPRTTYLYTLKQAQTIDGKKYDIDVDEIYVNGKPHRNDPFIFAHGLHIETEEPIVMILYYFFITTILRTHDNNLSDLLREKLLPHVHFR